MVFKGWPVEAVEFYEGLEADNTKTYWQEHKAVYERCVKAPMDELLAELADDFGSGRVFRPYRDVRFSKDKTPYKLNCAAHLPGGYLSFSADELFVGSGLYMPGPDQLKRFRAAVDDGDVRLEAGVDRVHAPQGRLRRRRPRGAEDCAQGLPEGPPPHRAAEHKGIVMSKSWPVGAWLGTRTAKRRVVACLDAARPLNAWLERNVG